MVQNLNLANSSLYKINYDVSFRYIVSTVGLFPLMRTKFLVYQKTVKNGGKNRNKIGLFLNSSGESHRNGRDGKRLTSIGDRIIYIVIIVILSMILLVVWKISMMI